MYVNISVGGRVVLVFGAVATLCLPSFDTKLLAQFVRLGTRQPFEAFLSNTDFPEGTTANSLLSVIVYGNE